MPGRNGKKSQDSKQNSRIKKLESFIYKTIENKQVNYDNTQVDITDAGLNDNAFLKVKVGPDDGSQKGDAARIGNSITLLRQQYRMTFKGLTAAVEGWNQMRVIICEPLDGNQPLVLSDVLEYPSYSANDELVFVSPYTTKTATNRRYKIHMDKSFTLNQYKNIIKDIKHDVKWKNGKEVEFAGPGTEDTPTNHNMSILFVSDSSATPHPQVSYSVRSTYKDA
jgi:hypothetical protein